MLARASVSTTGATPAESDGPSSSLLSFLRESCSYLGFLAVTRCPGVKASERANSFSDSILWKVHQLRIYASMRGTLFTIMPAEDQRCCQFTSEKGERASEGRVCVHWRIGISISLGRGTLWGNSPCIPHFFPAFLTAKRLKNFHHLMVIMDWTINIIMILLSLLLRTSQSDDYLQSV